MSIKSELVEDGVLKIVIDGRFDATCLELFRQSFENYAVDSLTRYIIDLGSTVHLDSSALGMLLVLRDHAGGDTAVIQIINSSEDVKKIFTISSFDQLFDIQ